MSCAGFVATDCLPACEGAFGGGGAASFGGTTIRAGRAGSSALSGAATDECDAAGSTGCGAAS
eukprot:3206466-Pleurochrysis_carterae.AAC.1